MQQTSRQPLDYRRDTSGLRFRPTLPLVAAGVMMGAIMGAMIVALGAIFFPGLTRAVVGGPLLAMAGMAAFAFAGAFVFSLRRESKVVRAMASPRTEIFEQQLECAKCAAITLHVVRVTEDAKRRIECRSCGDVETETA